jgi:threonyl-tRNA synthetase
VNDDAGRDHRDINQDLPVFATDPLAGAGLPLWLPDGAVIRDELQRLAKDLARADGCQSVYSPVLGKRALFERSGHWAKFSDAARGLRLVDGPGEAAFYGPKLDLQVRDGRGHEETIATVQLDFNQPERFDLTYDAADGARERVMMIHRGTVGSMERVVAALLEHYQGRLPLWLAPVQVCVLSVRAEHDVADDSVQVTDIAGGFRGSVKAGDVVDLVRYAYENRMAHVTW